MTYTQASRQFPIPTVQIRGNSATGDVFNKTIIPLALVGYEITDSQRGA